MKVTATTTTLATSARTVDQAILRYRSEERPSGVDVSKGCTWSNLRQVEIRPRKPGRSVLSVSMPEVIGPRWLGSGDPTAPS
jgi:hypothetical protein